MHSIISWKIQIIKTNYSINLKNTKKNLKLWLPPSQLLSYIVVTSSEATALTESLSFPVFGSVPINLTLT